MTDNKTDVKGRREQVITSRHYSVLFIMHSFICQLFFNDPAPQVFGARKEVGGQMEWGTMCYIQRNVRSVGDGWLTGELVK